MDSTSSSPAIEARPSALARLLAGRGMPACAAVLAMACALPGLASGFHIDDYFHRVILLQIPRFRASIGTPREMFRFCRGDAATTMKQVDAGTLPWWTDPEIKAEFLQAITVETHILDYTLWPNSPLLMHAHSLVWLGLLTASVAYLYRRILGPTWTAGLAALMYALDDAHGTPAGWIANRNTLLATLFGVLAVCAHDAWRREGRKPAAILATILLAAALFSKEEGIAAIAYLFAYAVCLDPSGARRGVFALAPYAATVVVWREIRSLLGYGVRYMGLYVDPLGEPVRFLEAFVRRAPLLLLGAWTPIPSEVAVFGPRSLQTTLLLASMLLLAGLAVVLFPLLRRDPRARFFAVGMLLAVIPMCATMPADRLLTAPGVGVFGLIALFLADVFAPASEGARRGVGRVITLAVAVFLVVTHIIISPVVLAQRARNPLGPASMERKFYINMPLGDDVASRTVVALNPPSTMFATYMPVLETLAGRPAPSRLRVLSSGMPSVRVRREDARTLVVEPASGFLRSPLDELFRCDRRPFRVGDRVTLTGMTAEIRALNDEGRPAAVAFAFDVPLEDRSLLWLCFRDGRYQTYVPPAVGHSEVLTVGGLFDLVNGG